MTDLKVDEMAEMKEKKKNFELKKEYRERRQKVYVMLLNSVKKLKIVREK